MLLVDKLEQDTRIARRKEKSAQRAEITQGLQVAIDTISNVYTAAGSYADLQQVAVRSQKYDYSLDPHTKRTTLKLNTFNRAMPVLNLNLKWVYLVPDLRTLAIRHDDGAGAYSDFAEVVDLAHLIDYLEEEVPRVLGELVSELRQRARGDRPSEDGMDN